MSAGGSVSATNLDSRTSWSFAGSFEYRFNRVAGLELEATAVPTLESEVPPVVLPASSVSSLIFPPIPIPIFTNRRGRAVILTNNVRVHIPTTTSRVDPYFVAGGGVSNVRHTANITYTPVFFSIADPSRPLPTTGTTIQLPSPRRPITEPFATSSTALALTIGGGAGVRVTSHLWIEGDLRLFRLFGSEDKNAGRFGIGARYRF